MFLLFNCISVILFVFKELFFTEGLFPSSIEYGNEVKGYRIFSKKITGSKLPVIL